MSILPINCQFICEQFVSTEKTMADNFSELSDIESPVGKPTAEGPSLTYVREVMPINQFHGVRQADDLDDLVELPMLGACKNCFAKGIKTVSSSANQGDVERGGPAYFYIDCDRLTPANRVLALQIGGKVHFDIYEISIFFDFALEEDTTITAMEQASCAIVAQLTNQEPKDYPYTLEELQKLFENYQKNLPADEVEREEFERSIGTIFDSLEEYLELMDEREGFYYRP